VSKFGEFAKAHAKQHQILIRRNFFNKAVDCVVNEKLSRDGIPLPKGSLRCPSKYKGKTWRQIYADLLKGETRRRRRGK
jgi:hypothetical protein